MISITSSALARCRLSRRQAHWLWHRWMPPSLCASPMRPAGSDCSHCCFSSRCDGACRSLIKADRTPMEQPADNGVIARVLPAGSISPKTGVATALVHGLLSTMRDGTLLAMDLIRPEAPGAFPVVLIRTPYDKTREHSKP